MQLYMGNRKGGGGMWEKSAKFLAYTPQDRWTLFEVGLFVTHSYSTVPTVVLQKGVRSRKEVMPYFIMLILSLNQKNLKAFGLFPEPGCTVVLILYSLANLAKVITRCHFSHPCTVRLFTGTQKNI